MKSFIVFAVLVAAALAAPPAPVVPLTVDGAAQILRFTNDNIGVDGYNYAIETSNGIQQQEEGQLVDVGTEQEGIVVRGSFSYIGTDGVTYTVTYTAGKEGFQPQGVHLPA